MFCCLISCHTRTGLPGCFTFHFLTGTCGNTPKAFTYTKHCYFRFKRPIVSVIPAACQSRHSVGINACSETRTNKLHPVLMLTHLHVYLQLCHQGVNCFCQMGHGFRFFFFIASLKIHSFISWNKVQLLTPTFYHFGPLPVFSASNYLCCSHLILSVQLLITCSCRSLSLSLPTIPLSQFKHPYLLSHLSLSHLFWLPASIFLSHFPSSLFLTAISWAIASSTLLDQSRTMNRTMRASLSHAFCASTTFSFWVYNPVSVSLLLQLILRSTYMQGIFSHPSISSPTALFSYFAHVCSCFLNIPFPTLSFHFLPLLWLYVSLACQLSAV